MGILDPFDPKRDGWSFTNWKEAAPFSWDLYRRTYLAINPTPDPVSAPLDVAFFEIFKGCAAKGNCGGMSMLALALYKYGGYMGYCSPASFYIPADPATHEQPAQAGLHEAINIMQGRQFSAAGIRNFLDVVKAGQLNDGIAAWNRVRSGLASGDYCMLSLSNGIFGDAAHTVVPYRAETSGGAYVLHVWNPNRPYAWFPAHYDGGHNRIVITGPTSWRYDQNLPSGSGATIYDGSNLGWFFAIPSSLEIHKGRQPITPGFLLTGVTMLFVSGIGAAVTQIEDDTGRRLYTSDRPHGSRADVEVSPGRCLAGVTPWPWPGGAGGGTLPGELFIIDRPPGSAPLNISVRGNAYRVAHLASAQLTELAAGPAASEATDRLRLESSAAEDQAVVVRTGAPRRVFDIRHLRQDAPAAWRSVGVRNTLAAGDGLRIHAPAMLDAVEVSATGAGDNVEVAFSRYGAGELAETGLVRQGVPAGRSLRVAPAWERLGGAEFRSALMPFAAVDVDLQRGAPRIGRPGRPPP